MNGKTTTIIGVFVLMALAVAIEIANGGMITNIILTGTIYEPLTDEKILQINNTREIQAFYNTYNKYDNNIQQYKGVDPLLNYDATHQDKRISVLVKGNATDSNSFTFKLDCDNGEKKYFVGRNHGSDYLLNYNCFKDKYP